MKYCVENDLSLFEFHDSEFEFLRFDGNDLVVSVRFLNIHMGAEQNPFEHDMEIERAQIVFRGFRMIGYEPGRAWKKGDDGEFYTDEPLIVLTGSEGTARFLDELTNGATIFSFKNAEVGYSIDGSGAEPYFYAEFDFDSAEICWDEFRKKAWYELHRQYRYDVTLQTPEGDEAVRLNAHLDEENEETMPPVSLHLSYGGRDYGGQDRDYTWADAFADLQRKLPEGVRLKCCMTCGHRKLRPDRNAVNEILCMKDVPGGEERDAGFCAGDGDEQEKRIRQYCDVCEDYKHT